MAKFGNRYYPSGTKITTETIKIEMVLPSGREGYECFGQPVVVCIDRELAVSVQSFKGDVLLSGAWNLSSVCWDAPSSEEVLCRTAIEMVAAQVAATAKLFRKGWVGRDWLSARARAEVCS